MKYRNSILIGLSLILILSLVTGYYLFFIKKEEIISFSEDIIKSTPFTNEEKKSLSSSGNIVENNDDFDKISSLTRSICSVYNDYSLAVKSRYFTMLKKEVLIVNDTYKDDSFEFMYVFIPGLIYKSCATKDPEFNEKIIFYLQSDSEVVSGDLEKNLKEELNAYIDQLAFVDMESIDKVKIKNDKKYFDEYFFNKNNEEIVALFYPYYIKEGRNINNFLNKPSNSLKEEVDFKNKLNTVMLLNLKLIGFNDIEEFRTIIKSNYNISDINSYKSDILEQYKKLELKMLKEKNIDLKANLTSINLFKKYIDSGEYKKIFEDDVIKNDINDLGKKMTILSLITNDYADGLNEAWSGKEFFLEEEAGNNLIRLNFIYILNLNSDGVIN